MLEVRVLKAKETIHMRKNATFLAGELYFGRPSKDGMGYVVRSEEGYWIPFFESRLTINRYWYSFPTQFESKALIYMKNRKRLNEFYDVSHYFASGEFKQWWGYGTVLKDNHLWD